MRGAPIALVPLVAGLAGCGLGVLDEDPGGGANLPTLGAGPYGRLPSSFDTPGDEPFLVVSRSAAYADPACLPRDDGGVRLWFGSGDAIARAEVPGLTELPDVAPQIVLEPAEPWEQGRVAEPVVIAHDGGLVMFYEAGLPDDPRIGRADSADGVTWTRRGEVAPGGSPAIAVDGDTWHLFSDEPGGAQIVRRAGDGLAFGEPVPVVAPRPGVADAFDAVAVSDPFAVIQVSDAGRRHWGVWFAGDVAVAPDEPRAAAIGFAGSFDGVRWDRFAGVDPVLTAPAWGPCVMLDGPRGVLVYTEPDRLRPAIAAAVHP